MKGLSEESSMTTYDTQPRGKHARVTEHNFDQEPKPAEELLSLGQYAVQEAFTLLGEVESPYESLRQDLESRIVDQPAAIDAIIAAMEQSHVRMSHDNRPMASLAFLGPTGTGKTESARALADALSGADGVNLVKIDCSNYGRSHEVVALTGSPPGYVGSEITPVLAPDNIEQPGTVVLFDEIEKGDRALHDLMLQIMDDGKIRMSRGEETNFRDTVVIMTSNLGATEMAKELSTRKLGFNFGEQSVDAGKVDAVARTNFKKFFRPEFVNRLDDMIVFHPLSETGLGKVLDVKLEMLNDMYEHDYGVRLTLSELTHRHLVETASGEAASGARPIVRALEKQVQATLGRYLQAGAIDMGSHVHVYHQEEVAQTKNPASDSPLVFAKRRDGNLLQKIRAMAVELPAETHYTAEAKALER